MQLLRCNRSKMPWISEGSGNETHLVIDFGIEA